eukprot:9852649-Ditylum_brightwellii.AAC.1
MARHRNAAKLSASRPGLVVKKIQSQSRTSGSAPVQTIQPSSASAKSGAESGAEDEGSEGLAGPDDKSLHSSQPSSASAKSGAKSGAEDEGSEGLAGSAKSGAEEDDSSKAGKANRDDEDGVKIMRMMILSWKHVGKKTI